MSRKNLTQEEKKFQMQQLLAKLEKEKDPAKIIQIVKNILNYAEETK